MGTDRRFRDTSIIFEEPPVCVPYDVFNEFSSKNGGKFDEEAFIDEYAEEIETCVFKR